MLRGVVPALIVGCWGCWGAPKPTTSTVSTVTSPRGSGPIWSSPIQPYRTGRTTFAIAAHDRTVLVGSDHGFVIRMDLATGKITAEKQLDPEVTIYAIAPIAEHRWLAIGETDKARRSWILDDNLAASPIDLHGGDRNNSYGTPEIVVLDDGNLVISGRGLPLAIYDGKTLALRDTVDTEVGWSHLRVSGKILTGDFRYRGWRFDLTTKVKTQIPPRAEITDAGYVILERKDAAQYATLHEALDKPGTPFGDPVDRIAIGKGTFVTMLKSQMQIRTLPGGEIVKRVELGASAKDGTLGPIVLDGKRAIVEIGSVIRVVDLATGTVSSEGEAPFGRDNRVSIDATGTVLAAGRSAAWQVRDGKLASSMAYDDFVNRTSHLGVDASHVTMIHVKHVERRAFDKPGALMAWDLEDEPYDVWYGARDVAVFDLLAESGPLAKAVIARAGKIDTFVEYNPDATLWDVDVDTGEAIVVIDGRAGLAKNAVASKVVLRVPSCDETNEAHLEQGGKRAITVGDKEIAVWDRASGVLLGAAKFARIRDQAFIPSRSEIIVALDDAIGVWSPANGDLRVMPAPKLVHVNVAADGKRVVASFGDGHVAVYDMELLYAQTLAPPVEKATVPDTCGDRDPFEAREEDCGDCGDEGDFGD